MYCVLFKNLITIFFQLICADVHKIIFIPKTDEIQAK